MDQQNSGSPLAAYFPGWNGAGQETQTAAQRATAAARLMQVQQIIADCMAKQGFTYTPWLSPMNSGAIPDGLPAPGTLEYAQEYGVGIVADPIRDAASLLPAADPNDQYATSLSRSQRYAYNVALLGRNAADIQRGEEEGNPVSKNQAAPADDGGGCRRAANEAVFPEDDQDQAARDLYAAAKLAVSNVDTDPQVAAALQRWSDCMVSAGDPRYTRRIDVFNQLMGQFTQVDASDAAAIAAFHATEIKNAVDDLTCADTSGYTDTYDSAREQVERKFIADHQAELDAYVAEYRNR